MSRGPVLAAGVGQETRWSDGVAEVRVFRDRDAAEAWLIVAANEVQLLV